MEKRYGYISKLAREAGISQAYLSQILSGVRCPRIQVAKRLAEATDTEPIVWQEGDPIAIHEAIDKAETVRRQKIAEDARNRGDYDEF